MNFDTVWDRIKKFEGETFYTITGKAFAYRIIGNSVVPEHTGFPLSMSNFKKVYDMGELSGPGQISGRIMGSSYVFAILMDSRIK